jgi:hypothetical protein
MVGLLLHYYIIDGVLFALRRRFTPDLESWNEVAGSPLIGQFDAPNPAGAKARWPARGSGIAPRYGTPSASTSDCIPIGKSFDLPQRGFAPAAPA